MKRSNWQRGAIKYTKKSLLTIFSIWIVIVGTGLLYLFGPFSKKTEAAWFDDSWGYRVALSFDHSPGISSPTKVKFDIDTATLITAGKMQSDCDDSRFTDIEGNILRYYLDSSNGACNTNSTDYYVLLPTINHGNNVVYHYYGNPGADRGTEAAQFSESTTTPSGASSAASEEKAQSPVGYWKLDDGTGSSTNDATTNNNDGTITGATWQSDDMCVAGKCLLFDGSDDQVALANDINNITAVSFEAWVKPQSQKCNAIFTKGDGSDGSVTDYIFLVGYNGTNCTTSMNVALFGGGGWDVSTSTLTLQQWTHVAATYDGSTKKFYINGKLDRSVSRSGTIYNSASAPYIGRQGTVCNCNFFDGFLDEVKTYNYVLSAAQIQADFNGRGNNEGASMQVGQQVNRNLSDGLVGYWKQDEAAGASTAIDYSGIGNNLTYTFGATPTSGKFGNGGFYDGSNDYANIAPYTGLPSGSAARTFATWFKFPSSTPVGGTIGGWGNNSTNGDRFAFFSNTTCGGDIGIEVRNDAKTFAWTHDTNWHHFVAVLPVGGTTINDVKLYLDGVEKTSYCGSGGGTTINTGGCEMILGRIPCVSSGYRSTTLDETRIYNRALSNKEIADLYNFAPRPVGYWKFDENSGTSAFDTSSNGYTGTLSSSPTWTNGKFGAGLLFNSAGQMVQNTSATAMANLNTLTLESWVKIDTMDSTYRRFIHIGQGLSATYHVSLQVVNDGTVVNTLHFTSGWGTTRGEWQAPNNSLSTGRWHHVAVTYDYTSTSSDPVFYVDGVKVTTTEGVTPAGTKGAGTNYVTIGNDDAAGTLFRGTIDDVRIYSYSRTAQQIVEDMNAGHPAPGSPVGSPAVWLKFEEGVNDACSGGADDNCNSGSSGNTYDFLNQNGTFTNSGKVGRGIQLNGSNADVTQNDPGTFLDTMPSALTISGWYKPDATSMSVAQAGFGKINVTDQDRMYLFFNMSGSNAPSTIQFDYEVANGGYTSVSTGITWVDDTWYHVAVTWDTTNGIKVYVNGLLRASSASATTLPSAGGAADFTIGSDAPVTGVGSTFFKGTIDEFKQYNFTLTADQIKADMNQGKSQVLGALGDNSSYEKNAANQEYCVPGDSTSCAAPIARWDFEETSGSTLTDKSGSAINGTWQGTLGSQWTNSGRYGRGGNFNGSDNYITTSRITQLEGSSETWTIQGWFRLNPGNSGSRMLFFYDQNATAQTDDIYMYWNESVVRYQIGGGAAEKSSSITNLADGKWHHIAFIKTATNAIVVEDGVTTNNESFAGGTFSSSWSFYLGYGGNVPVWNGQMDKVMIYDYDRTPPQVAQDYNQGEPVSHWKFDECSGITAYDSAGSGNTGTITIPSGGSQSRPGSCPSTDSAAAWNNGQNGKYNGSIYLDGTNDYIQGDSVGTNLPRGSASRTISAWIKVTDTASADRNIFHYGTAGGAAGVNFHLYINTGSGNVYIGNGFGFGTISNTTDLRDGNWHYVAGSWSSVTGQLEIWVDGRRENSGTPGTTPNTGSGTAWRMGVFLDGGTYYVGGIDDVKVYGYALNATQIKNAYNQGAALRFGPSTGTP